MSIIGVLLATVTTQFLGVIWYSDALFRKPWMRGLRGPPVVNNNLVYLATAAATFGLAFFLDSTLQLYFHVHDLHSAIQFALLLTIPAELLQVSHTGFEGRSIGSYLVNAGFDAAVLITVCVLVTIL